MIASYILQVYAFLGPNARQLHQWFLLFKEMFKNITLVESSRFRRKNKYFGSTCYKPSTLCILFHFLSSNTPFKCLFLIPIFKWRSWRLLAVKFLKTIWQINAVKLGLAFRTICRIHDPSSLLFAWLWRSDYQALWMMVLVVKNLTIQETRELWVRP